MRAPDTADFADCGAWQAMLDREAADWPPIAADACIGVIRKADHAARQGTLLLWRAAAAGVRAVVRDYGGDPGEDVALLLVADDEALAALRAQGMTAVPSLVRRGGLLPYVLKTLEQLEAAGLAEFVEDLGLVFPKH